MMMMMNVERIALIGMVVAAVLFGLVQSSGGQTMTTRYSMHAVGLDGGRSIAWIIDHVSGTVKACGIVFAAPKAECTPEAH
jgi:hypothetical protein